MSWPYPGREGLSKAEVEVPASAERYGSDEVAEAAATPGGVIMVWLKPEARAARRDDVEVLRRRVDELEGRLSDKLDLLLDRQAPALSRGARRGTPPAAAPSPLATPSPPTADR